MRGIHHSLTDYYKANGKYLAAVTQCEDRLFSWRYIIARDKMASGHIDIWYNWDVDESWQDTHNNEEIAFPYFACHVESVASKQRKVSETSYLMLLRPNTNMDSLSNSVVIVVESADCGIHWMEPRDLSIETLHKVDNPFGKGLLNSYHDGYVYALRKNGNIIRISKNLQKCDVLAILEGK